VDRERLALLRAWVEARGAGSGRAPHLYDNVVTSLVEAVPQAGSEHARAYLLGVLERTVRAGMLDYPPRFAAAEERVNRRDYLRRHVPVEAYACGQGVAEPLYWRGRRLLKSVWDLAIYGQLLQEVRPRTLVELGSGSGASAAWFADQAAGLGLELTIYSLDAQPPDPFPQRPDVCFVRCDLTGDRAALTGALRRRVPGAPLLVVEDAHVAVAEVLGCLDAQVEPGDYLVVEDSADKQHQLADFLAGARHDYLVDRALCDRFGLNVTSAMNSVLTVGPARPGL
jgi:cephalosporin hydroxylase